MAIKKIENLRDFPSIEQVLQDDKLADAINSIPRPVAAEVVKTTVATLKEKFRLGNAVTIVSLHKEIIKAIDLVKRSEITRVINATGILVHTNLGRAPLSPDLFDCVKKTVTGYGNVEFDLSRGTRGSRGLAAEKYLATMAETEAATVVNNNAASLLMILNSLANRKEVIVSRGELVQIGGGFRIPDILKRSGSKLCEVGTTNITSLSDYEAAINKRTGLILKVHRSNFVQAGFTDEVSVADLAELCHRRDIPMINDLGSGVLIPTRELVGFEEPSVQQSVRAGADLTCFSGDKMLGGVQSGLIVGRSDLIKKIKKNPLFRTVRVDKIILSLLEKLLTIYLNGTHLEEIKLWRRISISESELYHRGKQMLVQLGNPDGISVEATKVYLGGGALPEVALPSVGIVFSNDYKPNPLMRQLRQSDPPIIGRIEKDHLVLDLKAIDEADLQKVVKAIKSIIE